MQTFLPYPDITNSLVSLDRKRLMHQRGQAKTILLALEGNCPRLENYGAVRMWKGYEGFLVRYGIAACRMWLLDKTPSAVWTIQKPDPLMLYFRAQRAKYPDTTPPFWLGMTTLHESHRSRLIQKAPGTYRPIWPDTPDNLPLFWPV